MVLLIGFFYIMKSFANNIERNWNESVSNFKATQNHEYLNRQLSHLISFHSNVKQLSINEIELWKCASYKLKGTTFNHTKEFLRFFKSITFYFRLADDFITIYKFITTAYFLWSILTICDTLLTLHVNWK